MANNYVLGAGKIYFDLLDANDEPTGERYVGNTPGFSITAASETLDHYSDDFAVRELDAQALLQIDRDATITIDNIDADNMAAFIVGTKSTRSQSSQSVTAEVLGHSTAGILLEHTYQLGVTASDPTGARNVTAVAVKGTGGTPTYVENTDYTVDLAAGRVTFLTGGTITAGSNPEVDYTTAAETRDHIEAAPTVTYAAIRYIADNREGENRDLYAPKVLLAPDGEHQLKGSEWATMGFAAKLQKRGTLPSLFIDGVSAA